MHAQATFDGRNYSSVGEQAYATAGANIPRGIGYGEDKVLESEIQREIRLLSEVADRISESISGMAQRTAPISRGSRQVGETAVPAEVVHSQVGAALSEIRHRLNYQAMQLQVNISDLMI